MNRSKIWTLCLATCFATSILNTLVWFFLGMNLFSFSLYLIIPVGTIVLSIAALSGYYFGAKKLEYQSSSIDLFFLFGVALLFGFSIFLGQYLALLMIGLPDSVSFVDFFSRDVTKSEYITYRHGKASNQGSAGEVGWLLFLVQFACLFAAAKTIYSFADNRGDAVWKD
jgi:hypothetical protein